MVEFQRETENYKIKNLLNHPNKISKHFFFFFVKIKQN